MAEQDTTHFGFEQVASQEKQARVRAVFDSVASRYDIMNDLMSMGVHRLWKRFAIFASGIRSGAHVLDLAGGTGDLTRLMSERVGEHGSITCADINAAMLGAGRRRLLDEGIVGNVRYLQCNAESLPLRDNTYDAVTIGFGLRNVTRKQRALEEMYRVLRPGGQVVILEFSQVRSPLLARIYDTYSFSVLPFLGERVAGDGESYRYLAESIRMHPPQEELRSMMVGAGFERTSFANLTGGIVALHRGYKF